MAYAGVLHDRQPDNHGAHYATRYTSRIVSDIDLLQCEFESRILGNRRTVWVQPGDSLANGVCVFLDGEYYLAHVRAAGIVSRLQEEGAMPPMAVAYVSCIDHDVRWPESFCNPDFASFLRGELLPWLTSRFASIGPGDNALVGLSLTGLSAAHAALQGPDAFPRVLCQSGSFWWNEGSFAEEVRNRPPSKVAFRITVGCKETDEDVDHGRGLVQRESQVASNRRVCDALIAKGHSVSYHEFDGGHDVASWRNDLPGSLAALFEQSC